MCMGETSPRRSRRPKGKANKPKKTKKGTERGISTGDVAEILEKRYKIMNTFAAINKDLIERELVKSAEMELFALMNGKPVGDEAHAFDNACEVIAEDFRQFLNNSEAEHLGIPGVPTQAALDGVNHRLKIMKGARRPSFIDTGQYQNAAKVWTE